VWNHLDHLEIILGLVTVLGTPILYLIRIVRKNMKMIEEDHQRLSVLWKSHGYGSWNGKERRRKTEEGSGRYEWNG
jgi:hypothetical protein